MKKTTWLTVGAGLAGAFFAGKVIAKLTEESESIDEGNEYLSAQGGAGAAPTAYERRWKPALDSLLSFCGLVLLSPIYLAIAAAIKIDDPGPVFFTQKRVGRDRHFFALHKFRTMKMSTPHDVPTHELKDPEQYITKVGRILRKTSLDELPQIWDIWRGKMSVIGPRPALWNQADLVAEREKLGANAILPGLTGLAQISGRDELEIEDKAALDGRYTEALKKSSLSGLRMDARCFFGTFISVLKSEGYVEGGTGALREQEDWARKQST